MYPAEGTTSDKPGLWRRSFKYWLNSLSFEILMQNVHCSVKISEPPLEKGIFIPASSCPYQALAGSLRKKFAQKLIYKWT